MRCGEKVGKRPETISAGDNCYQPATIIEVARRTVCALLNTCSTLLAGKETSGSASCAKVLRVLETIDVPLKVSRASHSLFGSPELSQPV